jgi:tyrosine-protein kinase Etk/Wzc
MRHGNGFFNTGSAMSEVISTTVPAGRPEPLRMRNHQSAKEPTGQATSRFHLPGVKKRRGAEPFDALLWRLQSRHVDEASVAATVGLTGCERRTGVTTLAANLAVRASELQLGPVLLVETDFERPRLRQQWRAAAGPGLAEMVAGEASMADCLRNGPVPGLHLLSAAGGKRHEAPAWDVGAVDALLAEACADHSLVLFDLPPSEQLQHTVLLARRLDQVLLVVRAEHTQVPAAQRAADRLLEDGVPLVGAVLNRERSYLPRWLKRWI